MKKFNLVAVQQKIKFYGLIPTQPKLALQCTSGAKSSVLQRDSDSLLAHMSLVSHPAPISTPRNMEQLEQQLNFFLINKSTTLLVTSEHNIRD